jgi:hypothetical protein
MKRLTALLLLLPLGVIAADTYRVRIPELSERWFTVEVEKVPDPTPPPDPPPPDPPPPVSTTLLDQKQRDVLKRLWADKHPWAVQAQTLADYSPRPAYGDFGQWATLVWIATGDDAYARKAIAQALATFTDSPDSRNTTRENFGTFALHYAWLREEMTEEQRTEWRRRLYAWAELCLGRTTKPGWGTRLGDSDEVVGHYFGLVLTAQITAAEEPVKAVAITADPQLAAMREEIRRYCGLAKGGEWVESSEYNRGTLQLLFIGAYSAGIDQYPEVAALAREVAEQQHWSLTPDLKDSAQWGDEEHPHSLGLHGRVALFALLAGLTGDARPRYLIGELTKGKEPYAYWNELYRALWVFDPTVKAEPVPSPEGFRLANVGLVLHRGPKHLCQIHAPISLGVDHEGATFPDVRLWHNGEWVLDHVIGYGPSASCMNTALLSGVGGRQLERLTRVSAEGDANGCKVVTSCGGRFYNWQGSHHRPPAFCDEWTRTTEFQAPNRLTVRDSFKGRKPQGIEAYYEHERAVIASAPALWQVVYHCPVEPTATPEGFSWRTKGGQAVNLSGPSRRLVLKTERPGNVTGYIHESELAGWQIRFLSDEPEAEIVTALEVN